MYLLSQVFIFLAYVLNALSYTIKRRGLILITLIFSSLFFYFGYIFIDADSGAIINIIAILRQILFYASYKSKNNKFDVFSIIFINSLTVLISFFTYDGLLSLVPIVATVIYNYSIWQKSIKNYRFLGIMVELLWLIYSVYINSIISVLMEIIMIIVAAVNYARLVKENKSCVCCKSDEIDI